MKERRQEGREGGRKEEKKMLQIIDDITSAWIVVPLPSPMVSGSQCIPLYDISDTNIDNTVKQRLT